MTSRDRNHLINFQDQQDNSNWELLEKVAQGKGTEKEYVEGEHTTGSSNGSEEQVITHLSWIRLD